MKTPHIILTLLWTLCSGALSAVHYCPENGETVTVAVSGPTQIKTVFEKDVNKYRQNQNCRWIISASSNPDNRIQISVDTSDLQYTPPNADCTLYDYIELRNGKTSSSPLLKRWCGGVTPYTIISDGNAVYVSFTSDDIHLSENSGVTLNISVFSVDPTDSTCPLGWMSTTSAPTSCYSVKTHAETWKDAQGFCNDDRANLVTLNDVDTQQYVLAKAKSALGSNGFTDVWIGLNDIIRDDSYVWVDGTSVLSSFSESKVPLEGQRYKDCMLVNIDSGAWTEGHCDRPEGQTYKYPFICERKEDGTTVPKPSPPVEAITYYCQNDGKILYIASVESARIQMRVEGTSTYGQNLNCKWVINSGQDPYKRILVKVTQSKLQWTPSDAICYGYDHVEVKDGSKESSPTLSTFCGTMNPYTLISSSNVMYISFTSGDRQVYSLAGATLDFSFFSVAPGNQECPPGWFSDSPTGKYCYSIRTHVQTWVEAQQFCNNDQANLVSLETEEESKFVIDYAVQTLVPLKFNKMWIGLNDIAEEGKMVWIDGTTSTAKSKILNQPYTSNLYEDCVVVQLADRTWAEDFCTNYEVQTTTKYPFVCKRKRDGSTVIHAIPRAKAEKEGPKGNLAPKPLIIFGVIVAIAAVVGLGLLAVYCIKKKKENPPVYTSPSHTNYQSSPTPSAPSALAPPPGPHNPDDQPPPYEAAMEDIPIKGTPL